MIEIEPNKITDETAIKTEPIPTVQYVFLILIPKLMAILIFLSIIFILFIENKINKIPIKIIGVA